MVAQTLPIEAKALKEALARSSSCATIEELGRLCDADHAGGGDARVAEHVAGCLRCCTELALLKRFEAAAPRPEEEEAVNAIIAGIEREVPRMASAPAPAETIAAQRGRRSWQRRDAVRRAAAGLAFAAAMLILVVNLAGRDERPPMVSPDVASAPAVFRSSAVSLLAPAGDLDEPATELRWEAVPGAESYSVEVMEVDRSEVWSSDARQPSLSLPEQVRARIVPGKPLLWRVTAKDAAGKTLASSQVQRFRLRTRDPYPRH
jgi:hypothetical protein